MMNCDECERILYGEEELDATERLALDLHLQGCESCLKKEHEIRSIKTSIAQLARQKPEQPNSGAFMTRVIAGIEHGQARSTPSVLSWLFGPAPKVALTILSVALIVFLLNEQRSDIANLNVAMTGMDGTTLNSREFVNKAAQSMRLTEENTLRKLYTCAQEKNCDNQFVKSFKRKFNQN